MIAVAVVIGGWLLASAFLAWRRIAALKRFAHAEWRAYRERAAPGVDETTFKAAYLKAHRPRAPFWRLGGLVLLIGLTPMIFLVMDVVWPFLVGNLRLEGFEDGLGRGRLTRMIRFGPEIGAQAASYFLIIGAWVAAAAVMIRAYHRRRPRRFEEELRLMAADRMKGRS